MSEPKRTSASVKRERAVLAGVILPELRIDRLDPFSELRSLAESAGAVVVDELWQNLKKPAKSTFMGKGKVGDLSALVESHEAEVVIFENDLTPSQIRNIEEVVECKVLDRSELILDIFANRARTYEAKLQVELAQLEYTYPRLRAMWSHLERIVGGSPAGIGTRGPGEQQLEVDRRIVQRRKAELRREIRKVQGRKRREVEHRNRDFYTVGIVGYTNAGKSTLFNTLTEGDAYADDKLFATLDTRTRKWKLGGGSYVMLSDTIGFVRDLPHHLVASFRATLEESIHSDLLLIVVDVADANARDHVQTVFEVLEEIGAGKREWVMLLNKTDLLEDNAELLLWQNKYEESISISAKQGIGVNDLVDLVRSRFRGEVKEMTLRLPMGEGRALQMLESGAEIHEREYGVDNVTMRVTIGKRQLLQLRAIGAGLEVVDGWDGNEEWMDNELMS